MVNTKPPAQATPDDPYAELTELILQTPGAQTREEALAHIAARKQTLSEKQAKTPPSEEHLAIPEPLPPILSGPDQFAAGYWERLKEKTKAAQKGNPKAKTTPTKRSKPRLVVDNDKPKPSDKK